MTSHSSSPDTPCAECPLVERRTFLRDATALVAGIVAALGGAPGRAAALTVRYGRPIAERDPLLTYPVPAEDGAQIDKANQVIVVRWQQKAYAFNLACPHQNTALRWQPEDAQFQCPRHHSRYQPDGVFISGRATRSMDRFALRLGGGNLVVDVSQFFRQDKNPVEWAAAVAPL